MRDFAPATGAVEHPLEPLELVRTERGRGIGAVRHVLDTDPENLACAVVEEEEKVRHVGKSNGQDQELAPQRALVVVFFGGAAERGEGLGGVRCDPPRRILFDRRLEKRAGGRET